MSADFIVSGRGGDTVFLLTPITIQAREWIDENVSEERTNFGDGIAVEHRYIVDLVEGIQRDGLVVA